MLPRPRTGLQDMVIEVDPGTDEEQIDEGSIVPLTQTATQVQPDEVLATLDADTRAYLQAADQRRRRAAFSGDNGIALSQGLRRFEPFARDIAAINALLSKRRDNIAQLDPQLRRDHARRSPTTTRSSPSSSTPRTRSSAPSPTRRQAIRRVAPGAAPDAHRDAHARCAAPNEFAIELTPALRGDPSRGARLRRPPRRSCRSSSPTRRGRSRPRSGPSRARSTEPVQAPQRACPKSLGPAAQSLKGGFTDLNRLLNMLAYNPPGGSEEGYLFWLTWLNHNANAVFHGPGRDGPAAARHRHQLLPDGAPRRGDRRDAPVPQDAARARPTRPRLDDIC